MEPQPSNSTCLDSQTTINRSFRRPRSATHKHTYKYPRSHDLPIPIKRRTQHLQAWSQCTPQMRSAVGTWFVRDGCMQWSSVHDHWKSAFDPIFTIGHDQGAIEPVSRHSYLHDGVHALHLLGSLLGSTKNLERYKNLSKFCLPWAKLSFVKMHLSNLPV